ncbi:MAG: restriction endonuclease subunit S [Candidatus Absconditabacteria bacterium]
MKKQSNINPGYKNSPLGPIPENWTITNISDSADILDNKRKPFNKEERSFKKGKYPYYGANGVVDYIDEYIFDDNLILIAEDGGYFDEYNYRPIAYLINGKSWVNNHAHVLKAKHNIYQNYLFYSIEHKNILPWLNGGGRAKLNKSELEKIEIPLPPLPEQQKIATILKTTDETIEITQNIIKKLEQRNKGLQQKLLTGKVRVKGFTEKWREFKLLDLFDRVTRKNDENNTNVLTISAQKGLINQESYFKKQIASELLNNYYLLLKDEFAYNKSYSNGYSMGAIKRLKYYDKGVVTTLYICFKLKEKINFSHDFFECYFENQLLVKSLEKIANEGGRAHGLLNVTPSDFFNIKITIPSVEEQKAIADILYKADQELNQYKMKLEKLKLLKKGLMQQLLTGKVRVKSEKGKVNSE